MRLSPGTSILVLALSVCAASCQPSNNPRFAGQLELSVVSQSGNGQTQTSIPSQCSMSIDFGNVRLTQQSSLTLAITNKSNSSVLLNASQNNLKSELTATIADRQPEILAPGNSTQIVFLFQAVSPGAVASTFEISTDAPALACGGIGTSIAISLSGNAVDFMLGTDPRSIDFGPTAVGQSAIKNVTLTNATAVPIDGIQGSLSGAGAPDFSISGLPGSLAAGASTEVQVTYAPLVAKPSSSAAVTFTGGDGESAVTTLLGQPFGTGLVLSSTALQFGYILPPSTAIVCTTASNRIGTPITLSGIIDFGTAGGVFFSSPVDAATPPNPASLPVTLQPGDSAEICFEFAPPAPASDKQFTGQATIKSDDPSGINPTLTLSGWGGGPILDCRPSSVDFGEVLDSFTATIPVTCTNVGSGIAEANLILGSPSIASSVFSASFDKTTHIYPAQGLAPGQSAQIDVVYAPKLAAHDQGTLVLTTNAGNGSPLYIPVTGQGLNLGPCQYVVAPASVDFGNVVAGTEPQLSFAVENIGGTNCLISDLRIANQTSPVFSVVSTSITPDPQTGVITLPPAAPGGISRLVVEVRFSPARQESDTADVLFGITDPVFPHQSVALSGTSEPTCVLVEPSNLDFGTVGASQQGSPCSGATRSFSVFNICASAATIRSFTLQHGEGDVAAQFSLPVGASLPLELASGGGAVFQMSFQPTETGRHTGRLLISDGTVDTPLALTGNAIQAATQTDTFTVSVPTADVLFIVEVGNSTNAQQQIAQALPTFLGAAGSVDYRIAVTTDDDSASTGENGRLLPCPGCSLSGLAPTIVSPSSVPSGGTTPDPGKVLADLYASVPKNAALGVARHYFLSLYDALVRAPLPGVDFFRSGAYFAAVADAQQGDDNSYEGAGQHGPGWFSGFFAVCFEQPYLFAWDQIEPSGSVTGTGLIGAGQIPSGIGQMIAATHGLGLNLSDPAWVTAFSGVWSAATAAAGVYALSATPPGGATDLSVAVNGVGVPQLGAGGLANWTFDSASDTLAFTSNHPLSLGDAIAVSYPIGCE